eukprot:1186450-Prorocentrum_minimum.AAC.2
MTKTPLFSSMSASAFAPVPDCAVSNTISGSWHVFPSPSLKNVSPSPTPLLEFFAEVSSSGVCASSSMPMSSITMSSSGATSSSATGSGGGATLTRGVRLGRFSVVVFDVGQQLVFGGAGDGAGDGGGVGGGVGGDVRHRRAHRVGGELAVHGLVRLLRHGGIDRRLHLRGDLFRDGRGRGHLGRRFGRRLGDDFVHRVSGQALALVSHRLVHRRLHLRGHLGNIRADLVRSGGGGGAFLIGRGGLLRPRGHLGENLVDILRRHCTVPGLSNLFRNRLVHRSRHLRSHLLRDLGRLAHVGRRLRRHLGDNVAHLISGHGGVALFLVLDSRLLNGSLDLRGHLGNLFVRSLLSLGRNRGRNLRRRGRILRRRGRIFSLALSGTLRSLLRCLRRDLGNNLVRILRRHRTGVPGLISLLRHPLVHFSRHLRGHLLRDLGRLAHVGGDVGRDLGDNVAHLISGHGGVAALLVLGTSAASAAPAASAEETGAASSAVDGGSAAVAAPSCVAAASDASVATLTTTAFASSADTVPESPVSAVFSAIA